MDISTNRQIGDFVLDQQIGGGGTAFVYRAYQPTVNRYVALKVIDLSSAALADSGAVFERRFVQEAHVLASLEHPHIVPVYHYGVVSGECAYIAMRLMPTSLNDLLHEGQIPPDQVIDIASQLIAGLGYAHRSGVLHLDIKPGNVLFDEAGSACLADFGLTKVADHSLDLTSPRMMMDMAVYVSPEQIRGVSIDNRSDIYSLGVVMYQMLTGRLPFEVDNNLSIGALLKRIESEQPIPPRKLNPEVPVEVERVVMQALGKEPRERFFDVQEMAEALEAIPGTRIRVRAPAPSTPRPAQTAPRSRRNFALIVGGALLLVLIVAAILIGGLARGSTPPRIPTIVPAQRSSVEAVVPTADEIAQAQRRLGAKGMIAYIACSLNSQYQAARAREMQDAADNYGLTFRAYDSQGDGYKELTLIEQARLEGAKALILCPLKPDLLSDSLTSVESAAIPLVLTDLLGDSYGGVMLDQGNHEVGRLVGDYAGQELASKVGQSARIVILDAPDYSFSDARVQGFLDGLREHLPNAEIVMQKPTGADQTASESTLAELLRSGQMMDAIFSVTDAGAYGAVAALNAAGVAPDAVIVTSVDAESPALDDIYNQVYLRASVDLAREAGSRGALDAAVKLLGGGTLPQIVNLPSGMLITRDIMVEQSPKE